ncbi:MAG: hypothetical protein ACRC5A_02215 [Enterobacteriaceae bacterium]
MVDPKDPTYNRVILSQQKGSLVGYETGATIPDGVWSISVKNSPTIQHSQEVLGLDSYDSNDYPEAAISASVMDAWLPLPGTANNMGGSGVIRPRNIAFHYIMRAA